MNRSNSLFYLFVASTLAACGGGSAGDTSNGAPSAQSYQFITPKVGTKLVFSSTLVDNLNNTLNRTLVETITAVNADGSFTSSWVDPSGDTVTSGSVDQTFYPTVDNDNSAAQTLSATVSPYSGAPYNCTYSPHSSGAPSPLAMGQTWAFTFTDTCGVSAPQTVSQSGTFVDVESITVPAGTFNAFKLQSTVTYAAGGTTYTKAITNWRNAASTDARNLKQVVNYTFSGATPVPGTVVSDTRVLQSYQAP